MLDMKLTCLIPVLLVFGLFATAQQPDYSGYLTPISELFDIENGNFHDIEEDWNGFMWMATNDGLYRFDGTTVKHFTHSRTDTLLPHNQVLDIVIDHEKKELWLGTALGLCRLDPEKETSVIYQFSSDNPNSISDNIVRFVYMDRDRKIWASSFTQGISLYRPDTDDFENFYFDVPEVDSIQEIDPTINESRLNSHRFIMQDALRDEILWLASPLGLVSFNQESRTFDWPWKDNPQLQGVYPNNSVNVIYPLDERLIVGTLDKAMVYNTRTEEVMYIQPQTGAKQLRYVTHISPKSDTELWISYLNGLAVYDYAKHEVHGAWLDNRDLNQRFGIRYIDSADRVWINSSGSTVMYDPEKQVTESFPLSNLEYGNSMVLKQFDDKLLLLTRNGQYYHIFDLETNSWQSYKMNAPGLDWSKIIWQDAVRLNEDTWFFIDTEEVFQLNLSNNRLARFDIDITTASPRLTKAIIDQHNNLWVASIRIGLVKVNLDSRESTHYIDELNSDFSTSLYTWITDLYEDQQGYVWIRLARSYAVYQPEKDEFLIFPHREKAEQTFRYVQNFTETRGGDIWMSSTDLGFGKTARNQLEQGVIQKFTIRDGLLSNRIQDLRFGNDDLLWILTDKGISTYDLQLDSIRNYTWHRGIPKTRKIVPLANGKIALMLDQGGIALLDPQLMSTEEIIPQPYISAVNVKDNPEFNLGNRIAINQLNIHSDRDYLSFEFSALGYSNPKEFAYQLEGVDDNWVLTKEHRSTSYANLSPGEYNFLLKARLEGASWSPERQLSVYLVPRWWETWWFKLIAAALLLLLGYRVYRWRIDDIRQKERLKAEFQRKLDEVEMQALRSQMNPHFFFNSLNSIQLYIIKNDPKTAVEYLDRFSRLMRLILQNSRAKLVPLKDELEALQLYMELESLRFSVSFDKKIDVDPAININDIEIPPMLLQPFVENAIWHGIQHKGEKGEILIQIQKEGEFLKCIIQDDGIGREKAKQLRKRSLRHHKSMGMKITTDRLSMLNQSKNGRSGAIEIIDLYDKKQNPEGTRVEITLPII